MDNVAVFQNIFYGKQKYIVRLSTKTCKLSLLRYSSVPAAPMSQVSIWAWRSFICMHWKFTALYEMKYQECVRP